MVMTSRTYWDARAGKEAVVSSVEGLPIVNAMWSLMVNNDGARGAGLSFSASFPFYLSLCLSTSVCSI